MRMDSGHLPTLKNLKSSKPCTYRTTESRSYLKSKSWQNCPTCLTYRCCTTQLQGSPITGWLWSSVWFSWWCLMVKRLQEMSASASKVQQAWLIPSKASNPSCTFSNTQQSKCQSSSTLSTSMASSTIWNSRWSKTSRMLLLSNKWKDSSKTQRVKTCRTWYKSKVWTCNNRWHKECQPLEEMAALGWEWVESWLTIDLLPTRCNHSWITTSSKTKRVKSFSADQAQISWVTTKIRTSEWCRLQTKVVYQFQLRQLPSRTNSSINNTSKCKGWNLQWVEIS